MATAHPPPALGQQVAFGNQPGLGNQAALGNRPAAQGNQPGGAQAALAATPVQALVAAPHPPLGETETVFRGPVNELPVQLDVAVPVREFRMRDLLALRPGQVIESRWSHGDDLPLAAGDVELAWSEFEVVETRLAVRVTRLA